MRTQNIKKPLIGHTIYGDSGAQRRIWATIATDPAKAKQLAESLELKNVKVYPIYKDETIGSSQPTQLRARADLGGGSTI